MFSFLKNIADHYRFYELQSKPSGALPKAPNAREKYLYLHRYVGLILGASTISFACYVLSMGSFMLGNHTTWTLAWSLILAVVYFVISFIVNAGTKDFNLAAHVRLRKKFTPAVPPSVDIFLPTAGESLDVLNNTWNHVDKLRQAYKGKLTVYCLDDSDRSSVKVLAEKHGYVYTVRENRGWFKKAGNLRHGFSISSGEFIVIFDADFCPRPDFIHELLPYMYADPKMGIVQSVQYFDASQGMNWLQRGQASVQELFYRFSQVSRNHHQAAICVGTNALYRRRALNDTGGTALMPHSEDVHTGYDLHMKGWRLKYVPLILAKGLCPDTLQAFFKQQYRWCMGSMSLLSSRKFWHAKLGFRERLSYMSGFFYYISTALSCFYAPVVPILLLTRLSDEIAIRASILIIPSVVFSWIIYPLWHKCTYGVEAWSVKNAYSYAHLIAIFDALRGSAMQWQPTGTAAKSDYRYRTFRIMQICFSFIPAALWVGLASKDVLSKRDHLDFVPLLISGFLYLAVVSKVTAYGLNIRWLPRLRLARKVEAVKVNAG